VGSHIAILNGAGAPHQLLEITRMSDVIEMADDLNHLDPPMVGSS
jgi:hypothetical protein